MTKEESFELKEQKGRTTFAAFCSQNNIRIQGFAEDKYARWDVAYKYKGIKIAGEIKIRNNSSTEFPNHLLEVDKLKALQKMCEKRKDLRAHYINHFNDNRTVVWDITDLDLTKYKVEKRWCNKNDWDDEKIQKDVIFLYKTTAIIRENTDKNNPLNNLTMQLNSQDEEDEDEYEDNLPF